MSPTSAGAWWMLGSRAERLKASHSYGSVFALLVASFVFAASAPSEAWAASVLALIQVATLSVALWTSGVTTISRPLLVLVAFGIAAVVVELATSGETLRWTIWLLNVTLVVATMVVVALGVVDQREINRQSVTGAVCIYVALGMLFAFAYGAVAAIGEGPLFAQGTDGTSAIRLYYSYVTLTTLGYGDYTAAGDFARTLSVVEALLGQLYLVTVVAVIVGRLGLVRPPKSDS